jgi:hypothetical protein
MGRDGFFYRAGNIAEEKQNYHEFRSKSICEEWNFNREKLGPHFLMMSCVEKLLGA